MVRKGYKAELLAKKALSEVYGKQNVIKIAIGGASDYIVVKPRTGMLYKVIEVKECNRKKYYPQPKEENQFERIISFCKEHSIKAELWIKFPKKEFEKRTLFTPHDLLIE